MGDPVKITFCVAPPAHIIWSFTISTAGIDLTVILNCLEAPLQPLENGVTDISAVAGIFDELVALKEAILPVPAPAMPIEILLLVH